MNKHTPAPWGIEIAADGLNKWVGCSRYSVATIAELPNQVNIGEADANARLIAAAPELLEALTNLCGLAEKRPGSLHEYKAAVDSARAAIAKATGGAA
jgi:hypothetical protein